jgi:hypothetical protein
LGDTGSLHEEETRRGYARYAINPNYEPRRLKNPPGMDPRQLGAHHSEMSDRHNRRAVEMGEAGNEPSETWHTHQAMGHAHLANEQERNYARYHDHGGTGPVDPYADQMQKVEQANQRFHTAEGGYTPLHGGESVNDMRKRYGSPPLSSPLVKFHPKVRASYFSRPAPYALPKYAVGRAPARYSRTDYAGRLGRLCEMLAAMRRPTQYAEPRSVPSFGAPGWSESLEGAARERGDHETAARIAASRQRIAGKRAAAQQQQAQDQARKKPIPRFDSYARYDDMDSSEYADNVAGFGQDQGYQHGIADPNARQYPGHYA